MSIKYKKGIDFVLLKVKDFQNFPLRFITF